MTYLLDTCVVSQLRKKKTIEPKVLEWFANKDHEAFSISAVTVAELWNGIELLPPSRKKTLLEDWFHGDFLANYKQKIIPIDERVAKDWGTLDALARKKGRQYSVQDLYIAATAKTHNLVVVTINLKDFCHDDIIAINPWKL